MSVCLKQHRVPGSGVSRRSYFYLESDRDNMLFSQRDNTWLHRRPGQHNHLRTLELGRMLDRFYTVIPTHTLLVSTVFSVSPYLSPFLPLSRVVLMKRNTYMQRLVFSPWVKVPSSGIADSSSCIRSRLKLIIRSGIRVLCHAETELVLIAGFRGM